MRNHSYENDYDLHENETVWRTQFHIKFFALRLVVKQRPKRTRKWPITYSKRNYRELWLAVAQFWICARIWQPITDTTCPSMVLRHLKGILRLESPRMAGEKNWGAFRRYSVNNGVLRNSGQWEGEWGKGRGGGYNLPPPVPCSSSSRTFISRLPPFSVQLPTPVNWQSRIIITIIIMFI